MFALTRRVLMLLLVGLVIVLAVIASGCNSAHQAVPPVADAQPVMPGAASQSNDASFSDDAVAAPSTNVTGDFDVTVPGGPSQAQSFSLSINGKTPAIFNVSSSSPGCGGTNPIICTIPIIMPTGSDVFSINYFGGTNGTGTKLGFGRLFRRVERSTNFHIFLGRAAPKSVQLTLKNAGPFACNGPNKQALFVMAEDASANVIVGSYTNPVTLTNSDATGHTSLSTTTSPSSYTSVTLAYDGLPFGGANIVGTAAGASPGTTALIPKPLMFVSNFGGTMSSFPPVWAYPATANGNAKPLRTFGSSSMSPVFGLGIAVDGKCNVAVTNDNGGSSNPAEIDIFKSTSTGDTAPTSVISGSNTLLGHFINRVEYDALGKFYVSNPKPVGIAPSPSPSPFVEEFAAGASGNVAPAVTIGGSNTGFTWPSGLAVGKDGTIYVTDLGSSSPFCNNTSAGKIFIFGPGASGNVAPTTTIAGPHTTLNCPIDVAIDSSKRVYVLDGWDGDATPHISVFAPSAGGDAAPIREIVGSNTKLGCNGGAIGGLKVDMNGTIYVANGNNCANGVNSILTFSKTANGNVAPWQIIAGSNSLPQAASDIALSQ